MEATGKNFRDWRRIRTPAIAATAVVCLALLGSACYFSWKAYWFAVPDDWKNKYSNFYLVDTDGETHAVSFSHFFNDPPAPVWKEPVAWTRGKIASLSSYLQAREHKKTRHPFL